MGAEIVQRLAISSKNVVDGHGAGRAGAFGVVGELPRGRLGERAERDFELGHLESWIAELEDEALFGGIVGAVAVTRRGEVLRGLLAAGKVDGLGSELGWLLASRGALLGVCGAVGRRAGVACTAEQVGLSGSERSGGSEARVGSVGSALGDCVPTPGKTHRTWRGRSRPGSRGRQLRQGSA